MKTGFMKIGELIDIVRNGKVDAGYHVYADDALDELTSEDAEIFVAPASTFDKDLKQTLPNEVVEHHLGDFCSFALLEDVIDVALKMQPRADNAQIVAAIDYYMENDTFLEL